VTHEIKVIQPKKVSIKDDPILSEAWLQEVIANDPSVLGLGDLVLKDRERMQPKAGRLDLLLQDQDTNKRYEVEIQLGKTDESHIIRTIEYWDIERKRYPQYEHCAVIVAEEVTSRFLNVIGLFNGHIPLIAIQVNAYKIGVQYFLTFTTVLDEMQLGLLDEDEAVHDVADRNYWETERGSKKTVKIVEQILELITSILPGYSLKYNKFYIGLEVNGQIDNFVIFRAKRNFTRMEVRLAQDEDFESFLEIAGLNFMDYDKRDGRYRIKLKPGEVEKHKDSLIKVIREAKGLKEESTKAED
jgi:hypothetical protein